MMQAIYDVRFLNKGMILVAQRHINGPLERYPPGTLFELDDIGHISSRGYSEIWIRIKGKARFKSYDDYFRKDMNQTGPFVIVPECMFDA